MEPPPRLYHYEGLFTSCRSIDLPLKMLFTVLILIILIVIAAWNVSRKSYRRAPKDVLISSTHLMNLNQAEASGLLTRLNTEWTSGVFSVKICGRTTLLVNDWKLICLLQSDSNLDYYYSTAPAKFRRKWFGLWLSDYTLSNRPQLQSIVFHTFNTLSNDAFLLIGLFAVESMKSGRYQFRNSVLDSPELDAWVWDLVMELVFFNSPDFSSVNSSGVCPGKCGLLERLREHMVQLLELHEHGHIRLTTGIMHSSKSVNPNDLLVALDGLLSPPIRHALESFLAYREQYGHLKPELHQNSGTTSLLHQFVQAHHELDQEGEYVSFVSPTHIAHLLVEISLILRCSLVRALQTLISVLALRPDWQVRLCEEVKNALRNGLNCRKQFEKKPSGFALSSHCLRLEHIDCLPWTKSLINEAIRFSAPGFPINALRQALRDGQLMDFDYAEGELVLLNQLVYLSDWQLWEAYSTLPSPVADMNGNTNSAIRTNDKGNKDVVIEHRPGLAFRPNRFLSHSDCGQGKKPIRLSLPLHWARYMLTGHTVCVPNDFLYRLLTSIVVHLFGTGLQVSTTDNGTTADHDFVWLPRDSPVVSFTYPNT